MIDQHLGMVVQWEDLYEAKRAHTHLGRKLQTPGSLVYRTDMAPTGCQHLVWAPDSC